MKKETKDKIIFFIGLICLLDFTFLMKIGVTLNFGTILPGVLGLILIFYSKIKRYLKYKLKNKYEIFKKISTIIFIIWIITFFLIEGMIVINSFESEKRLNNIVVLGAGLRGERMSAVLKERMDTCLDYMNENPNSIVVVSGGQGIGETISEAEAMKRFLVSSGIDEKRVIKEDKSTSTTENLRFSKKIMINSSINQNEIMLISNDFHLFRAKELAKNEGFRAYSIPAKTPFYLIPNCYFREYFAVIKLLIFNE